MATWSVVATVREPPQVLQAFVAHHLNTGAVCVFLYFDDPDDPALAQMAARPRVQARACGAAHWRDKGGARPEMIQDRQDINATDALGRCREEWLVHIDADEFLASARPIGAVLAEVPPDERVVHVAPAERLRPRWRPARGRYDGFFKRARGRRGLGARLHKWAILLAYGRDRHLLRWGMFSHFHGKVFVRAGVPGMGFASHDGLRDGRLVAPWRQGAIVLLHFFADGPDDWARKLAFKRPHRLADGSVRSMGTESAARIGDQVDLGDRAVVDDLYRRFATASLWQYLVLRLFGVAFHHDLRLPQALAAVWPAQPPGAGS